ncbi:hypothetical protein [Haliangium sp.]|uniref:hypothetical protein n=1 Tax=Haliangium sp. TaxID=2663208 RepID=UPI003D0994E4
MAIPECTPLPRLPTPGEIVFPGGATLSQVLAASSEIPSSLDAATNLLAQASPALAPVMPLFNIVDAVQALVACMEAVPDALGPPPDPGKMAGALSDLVPKVAKLADLVPQLAAPRLVLGMIDTLIDYLEGVRDQIEAIVLQVERTAKALDRANELGDASLADIATCSQANTQAQLQAMADALAPVDTLAGGLNTLLELLGLPAVPPMADLVDAADPSSSLATIDPVITTLTELRAAVPLP